MVLFVDPDRAAARRGTTRPGTSLPFYGTRRGPGCNGDWWLVGPLAWACSDQADLSPADPVPSTFQPSAADGLPATYYFVKEDGASAYASVAMAEEGTSDRELEAGSGLAVVEQRLLQGESWVRTTKGLWVAVRDLAPARTSMFHGEPIDGGHLRLRVGARRPRRVLVRADPQEEAPGRASAPALLRWSASATTDRNRWRSSTTAPGC